MNKVIRFRSGFRSGESPTLPSPQLAFSAASADVQIGGSNTYPTLTNPYGVTVIWASSDPLVASIDSSTGVVTLLAEGEVQISATFNGNSLFSKQKVTYALNVEAAPIPVHEYVDLGLPSGLLWAKTNLGADNPEDDGLYFSWGNTEGHTYDSGYNFGMDYANTPGSQISADLSVAQDAARAMWYGSWRMPTKEEFKELCDNTLRQYVTLNGVAGCKFIKKTDSDVFIFIPKSGQITNTARTDKGNTVYCWSSSIYDADLAYNLYLAAISVEYPQGSMSRYRGATIRPVMSAQ